LASQPLVPKAAGIYVLGANRAVPMHAWLNKIAVFGESALGSFSLMGFLSLFWTPGSQVIVVKSEEK
jgi:hypothetical protein